METEEQYDTFNAPQFHDFSVCDEQDRADEWFDSFFDEEPAQQAVQSEANWSELIGEHEPVSEAESECVPQAREVAAVRKVQSAQKAEQRPKQVVKAVAKQIKQRLSNDKPQRKHKLTVARPKSVKRENSFTGKRKQRQEPKKISPKFQRSQKGRVESSEEQLLAQLAAEKKALQKKRQQNAIQSKKALQMKGQVMPVRSTKELTTPHEFHFATSHRGRSRSVSRLSSQSSKPNSIRSRSTASRASSVSLRPQRTKPQPFQLSSSNRKRRTSVSSTVSNVSFSDYPKLLRQPIHTRTASNLTVPDSPKFSLKRRNRPQPLSRVQREEEELHSFAPFRAKPVNRQMLEAGGVIGVPRIEPKTPTTPRAPHFRTEERSRSRPAARPEEPTPKPFRAKPFNANKFKRGKAVIVHRKSPTKPISPNITRPHSRPQPAEPRFQFKARPIPTAPPFVPTTHTAPPTAPAPFNLQTEVRGQSHEQKQKAKLTLQEQIQQARCNFCANPIREDNWAPAVNKKPPTAPQPFDLLSVELSMQKRELFLQELQRQQAEMQNRRLFKANPVPVNEPFFLKRNAKVTECEPFQLATEPRAEERTHFDLSVKQRIQQAENLKLQQQAEREEMEKTDLKQIRKELVHKPAPVLKSEWRGVERSDRPLTVPQTPELATRTRSKLVAV